MLLQKKCEFCKREFTNERPRKELKSGWGYTGQKRFSETRFCSRLCSSKSKFVPNQIHEGFENQVFIRLENKNVWTFIEKDDYEKVKKYRWNLDSTGYPCSSTGNRGKLRIRLHNLIFGKIKGKDIDHVNRNKLDNRRCNLRAISHRENILNQGLEHKEKQCLWCKKVFINRKKNGNRIVDKRFITRKFCSHKCYWFNLTRPKSVQTAV